MKKIVKIGLGSIVAAILLVGCGDSKSNEKKDLVIDESKVLTNEELAKQVVLSQFKSIKNGDYKGFTKYISDKESNQMNVMMDERCPMLFEQGKKEMVDNMNIKLKEYGLTGEQLKNIANESNPEIKTKLLNSCFNGLKLKMLKEDEKIEVTLKEKVSEDFFKFNYVRTYKYYDDGRRTSSKSTRTVQFDDKRKDWIVYPD